MPLIKNSVKPIQENDFKYIIERIFKLTIPNIVIWLLGFYTFFRKS